MGRNEPDLPVDEGKNIVEVLPGIILATYSKGYTALRLKGKISGGRTATLSRPLWREGLLALGNALLVAAEGARSYEEAHKQDETTEVRHDDADALFRESKSDATDS